MARKFIFVIILLSLFPFPDAKLFAQAPFTITSTSADVDNVSNEIDGEIPSLTIRGQPNPDLITGYTLNRSFAKEFAKILSIENAKNGATKYATLELDKTKGTFDFAPIVYRLGNYHNGNWMGYGNIHLKGQLGSEATPIYNSKGLNKAFQIGSTINFLIGYNSNFYEMTAGSQREKDFDKLQRDLKDEVKTTFTAKIAARTPASLIENRKILEDPDELRKAMWDSYSDNEEKLAEEEWTWKIRQWLSIGADGGGQVQGIIYNSSKTVADSLFWSATIRASYNYFMQKIWDDAKASFYVTNSIELTRKNSFADLTPQTWNRISKISDTTFLTSEQKSVYNYDSTYKEGFAPNISCQVLGIFEFTGFAIGFNVSGRAEYPITNKGNNSLPTKYVQSYGIVFPFKNKDGDRAINVEFFYSHQSYADKKVNGSELWGIKFAIPLALPN